MKHTDLPNANIDALIVAASVALAEKNSEYLNGLNISKISISPKVDRRVVRKISKEKEYKPAYVYRRISKMASILLIVCIAALSLCLSVEAVRTQLWNSIVSFFDEYIEIRLEASEIITPEMIETKKEPYLLPRGTTATVVVDNPVAYYVSYTVDEVEVMFYQQCPFTEQSVYTDNECIVYDIAVNGNDATLVEYLNSDKCYSIFWFDGEYRYILDSFSKEITLEELIAIAESVK